MPYRAGTETKKSSSSFVLLEFYLPTEATQNVCFQAEPHIPGCQGSVLTSIFSFVISFYATIFPQKFLSAIHPDAYPGTDRARGFSRRTLNLIEDFPKASGR